jgi:hypothetical protein
VTLCGRLASSYVERAIQVQNCVRCLIAHAPSGVVLGNIDGGLPNPNRHHHLRHRLSRLAMQEVFPALDSTEERVNMVSKAYICAVQGHTFVSRRDPALGSTGACLTLAGRGRGAGFDTLCAKVLAEDRTEIRTHYLAGDWAGFGRGGGDRTSSKVDESSSSSTLESDSSSKSTATSCVY